MTNLVSENKLVNTSETPNFFGGLSNLNKFIPNEKQCLKHCLNKSIVEKQKALKENLTVLK